MKEYKNLNPPGRRESRRFNLKISIDIVKDAKQFSFGQAVDISRDGAAIDALPPLVIGETYRFHFRGFGVWTGVVVRKFGVKSHGIRFDIDETAKRTIDDLIQTLLKNTPESESDKKGSVVMHYPDSKIRSF